MDQRKNSKTCVLPTAFAPHHFTLHQHNTSYSNVTPHLCHVISCSTNTTPHTRTFHRLCGTPLHAPPTQHLLLERSQPSRHRARPNPKQTQRFTTFSPLCLPNPKQTWQGHLQPSALDNVTRS